MNKKTIGIITLAMLATVAIADTFEDVGSSGFWGKINIPKLTRQIDANFAILKGDPGAKAGATVAASEQVGVAQKTVLTLTDTPVSVVYNGGETNAVGSTKIYDFPAGRILVLGAIVDSFLITSFPTNTMDVADNGDFGLGTAVPDADGLLNGTAIDIIPSTAIDGLTSTNSSALAASAQFDGTTTAKDIYINLSVDHGDLTGASTNAMTVGGTVTLHWINLGDY